MLVGYARICVRDRDLEVQRAALRKAGCETIIEVRRDGKTAHRDGLRRAINMMRPGDTLVVLSLETAAISVKHLMEMSMLLSERHIDFRCLEDDIDATGNAGNLMRHILSSLAEYERTKLRKPERPDRSNATAVADPPDRPSGIDEAKRHAAMALSDSTTRSVTEICKIIGISRTSFYRYKRCSGFAAAYSHTDAE
jgi:DNA invertase Pin-like site-specific DNA recombinase